MTMYEQNIIPLKILPFYMHSNVNLCVAVIKVHFAHIRTLKGSSV